MSLEQEIKVQIEKARAEMISLAKKYPLTSSEVITASQNLDKLLNKHTSIKMGC